MVVTTRPPSCGTTVGWAALPLVLAGAATVHVESAVTETIQDAVPDSQRAGALGLTDSVMVGAALLGSLLAPWLGSVLGPSGLLLGLAATTVGALTMLARRTPQAAGAPWVPAQRPAGDQRPALPRQLTGAEAPASARQQAGPDGSAAD